MANDDYSQAKTPGSTLQGRAEELALMGMRPNVLVADFRWVSGAADNEGNKLRCVAPAPAFLKKRSQRPGGGFAHHRR